MAQRLYGLKLTELMIAVVVITAILAVIGIPGIIKAARRAEQIEAKRTLQLIYEKERAYFSANGRYYVNFADADHPDGLKSVGVTISKHSLYVYDVHADYSGTGPDARATFFVRATTVGPTGLDNDPEPDSWAIDESGNLQCISDDLKE